ncbi:MAG: Trp biosynthesis-associated membrane protein [Candidatus Nanopelagicales bacterium]
MTDAPAEPDRRGYRTALVLLGAAAALLFLGYAQVWVSAVVAQEGLPSLAVELKGREVQPAASASAILALAGVAGLIATRRVGRAVTGVLLVVEGLIALVGALWFGLGADDRADVLRLVSDKAGVDVQADLAVRPWWLVVAVGGLLVVVVGVLAVLRGGTWPVMGRRYERTEGEAPASAAAGSASAWDQLDQGVDPTVDTSAADPSPTTPGPTRSAPGGPGAGMMAPTDAPEDTP